MAAKVVQHRLSVIVGHQSALERRPCQYHRIGQHSRTVRGTFFPIVFVSFPIVFVRFSISLAMSDDDAF
jgi:hypothetical protein